MSQKLEYDADTNELSVRPDLDSDEVRDLLCTHYEFEADPILQEYNCYDGRNYLVTGKFLKDGSTIEKRHGNENSAMQGEKYVFKIFNADSTSRLEWFSMINSMVIECATRLARDVNFSVPCFKNMAVICEIALSKDVILQSALPLDKIVAKNKFLSKHDGVYYVEHMASLSAHLPGTVVEINEMTGAHAYNFGVAVADLDSALKEIPLHTNQYQETFDWNILCLQENKFYSRFVETMEYELKRETMIRNILDEFYTRTIPKLQNLPQQWIHGDVNEHNILFRRGSTEVAGIIDFDDMVSSKRVVEVGTSLMHITVSPDPMKRRLFAKQFYQGYCLISPLDEAEMECLYSVTLVRYLLVCCVGDYQFAHVDPTNDYVITTHGWHSLEYLYELGQERFMNEVLS